MTSQGEIAAKFAAAIASATPILGTPTDDDLRTLRIAFLHVCLSISLVGSDVGKVNGLILADAAYQRQPGVMKAFDPMEDAFAEYDPNIKETTALWEQKKLAAVWTSKVENQGRIEATRHGCRQLILHVIPETTIISLKDEDTFYELVTPLDLLAHIAASIGGLEVTDVVTLLGDLPKYWPSDPRVPQFIMRMDDAGRKAQRAGLPISDAWLAAFATSSLLKANSFPNDRPNWDGRPKSTQTWTA